MCHNRDMPGNSVARVDKLGIAGRRFVLMQVNAALSAFRSDVAGRIMEFTLKLLNGGAGSLASYLAAHVLLCLLPAFFIAGAMVALIPKASITRWLGRNTPAYVSNAVEAMSAVTDRARVLHITSQRTPSGVRIAVTDSGTGIDPDNVDRVFDTFFTTKSHGMGMGLSICRSIVEAHGGRLSASSAHPHGSMFEVVLPAADGVIGQTQ
jgi:hypothetical protein